MALEDQNDNINDVLSNIKVAKEVIKRGNSLKRDTFFTLRT